MLKKLLSQTLVAAILLGAATAWGAYDAAQDQDVIGGLIREIKEQRAAESEGKEVAGISVSSSAAPAKAASPNDTLASTYEIMARCLARAALVTKRDIFKQPRANVEEFLRATLTQASYETGRFKSQLATNACNYWGMKDRMDVGADKIHYKGEDYERFPNMYEGCLGYMRAICRDRYAGWERVMSDKSAFLKHITSKGWCPDGDYVQDAMMVYEADRDSIERAVTVATNELYNPTK